MNPEPTERALRELAELAGPHQIQLNALGRRIRRRRHTRLAAASAGAVALVAACGWLLPNLAPVTAPLCPPGRPAPRL
jgi:ferric-dicitrate binding protein FerR (iron transport regulator)